MLCFFFFLKHIFLIVLQGFGLPSAIGAKVACPDKMVIDVDGTFIFFIIFFFKSFSFDMSNRNLEDICECDD